MTDYEINFLLYGTNSIFHNAGLSIYTLTGDYIDKHNIEFKQAEFEKVSLSKLENRLLEAPEDLKKVITQNIEDAAYTVKKFASSIGRQGVLFSQSNLDSDMKPHIHRQGYSTEILPCITVHYRLSGNSPAKFNYWDNVTQEDAIKFDLCKRANILEWCANKEHQSLELHNDKNVILFNSGLTPHSVEHSSDFNMYVIFDHVLLNSIIYDMELPIILHE